jgi:hypothetical protein
LKKVKKNTHHSCTITSDTCKQINVP